MHFRMHFRIGVDLDGVIYRWSDTARFLLQNEFGIDVGESLNWDHIKDHTTAEQWTWLWSSKKDAGGVGKGLFLHGNCFPGSFEALKELNELGDITIITHRPKIAVVDTLRWLATHEVPAPNLHVLYREEQKSSVQPQCQLYVDDKVENCEDLIANTDGVVCLWARPWNEQERSNGISKDIKVIDNWKTFIDLAKEKAWSLTVV
jgi:uncharacterized HAD superfamily protein